MIFAEGRILRTPLDSEDQGVEAAANLAAEDTEDHGIILTEANIEMSDPTKHPGTNTAANAAQEEIVAPLMNTAANAAQEEIVAPLMTLEEKQELKEALKQAKASKLDAFVAYVTLANDYDVSFEYVRDVAGKEYRSQSKRGSKTTAQDRQAILEQFRKELSANYSYSQYWQLVYQIALQYRMWPKSVERLILESTGYSRPVRPALNKRCRPKAEQQLFPQILSKLAGTRFSSEKKKLSTQKRILSPDVSISSEVLAIIRSEPKKEFKVKEICRILQTQFPESSRWIAYRRVFSAARNLAETRKLIKKCSRPGHYQAITTMEPPKSPSPKSPPSKNFSSSLKTADANANQEEVNTATQEIVATNTLDTKQDDFVIVAKERKFVEKSLELDLGKFRKLLEVKNIKIPEHAALKFVNEVIRLEWTEQMQDWESLGRDP